MKKGKVLSFFLIQCRIIGFFTEIDDAASLLLLLRLLLKITLVYILYKNHMMRNRRRIMVLQF